MKLKQVCSIYADYGLNISTDQYTDEGVPLIRTSDFDDHGRLDLQDAKCVSPSEAATKLLRRGDILFSRSGTVGRCLEFDRDFPCTFAAYLVRFRPRSDRVNPRFIFYWSQSQAFRSQVEVETITSTIGNFNGAKFATLDFPNVDLDTQKAIVSFLDREIGRIDQLISKRQDFLALIDEKRTSIVERAVNGSILAEHDQSGSTGWFGQMPSNWAVKRGRYLFRERQQRSVDGSEELLTVSHITGVTTRAEKDVNMFLAESLEGYKLVRTGDVVVNTMWAWMGAMGVSFLEGIASPSYGVYSPIGDDFDLRFLDLLLRSKPFVAEVNRRSKGVWASRLRLYPDAFMDILFPIPPRDAQTAILTKLSETMTTEERIAALSRDSVERLSELRSALITAAVTGQIDVRGQATGVTTRPNRARLRVIVGAEIVHRHQGTQKFGRVKNQKIIYLAEAHAEITEIEGSYLREAAGPLDRALVEETEHGMETAEFFRATAPNGNGGVTYAPLAKAGQHRAELASLLGSRADALRSLIDLLRDLDTRAAEAVATLYAVWNDALIDGEKPDDDAIVRAVLNDWHREKRGKFSDADLRRWLSWMRRNGLTPKGKGPRTISTTARDMFA